MSSIEKPFAVPLLEEVKKIAVRAGNEILNVYSSSISVELEYKEDQSPLTLADRLSHDAIFEGLSGLHFDYPIISEEGEYIRYSERKEFNTYWLVDPLDGTREFINRTDEFTVNIALMHDGAPVLGVVYVPVTSELYWAMKDEGAHKMDKMKIVHQLETHTIDPKARNLRILCSRSHINNATKEYIQKFDDPELIATGSSLKFLWIAEQKADIYPRLGPTMEWDTAAAQIILQEAGGRIERYEDGALLDYNKRSLKNPHFIAYAKLAEE
jgi:3'(2'), 5'-bisphosphate nucleotidase